MTSPANYSSTPRRFYSAAATVAMFCLIGAVGGCGTLKPGQPSQGLPHQRAVSDNIDMEIVAELNFARTDPAAYADVIARRLNGYDGREGKRAIREAIRVMRRTAPMPPLRLSSVVSRAAEDHVRDQGRTGQTGHTGSDGSNPFTRIQRYVETRGAAENIAYGLFTARDIVVELIIDDGVPNRGHRVNILNANYTHVGVATGPHERYGFMSVMAFSLPPETVSAR